MAQRIWAIWFGTAATALFGVAGPVVWDEMPLALANALLALAAALMVGSISLTIWSMRRGDARAGRATRSWRRVNQYIVITVLGAAVAVGGAVGYALDRNNRTVEQWFDLNGAIDRYGDAGLLDQRAAIRAAMNRNITEEQQVTAEIERLEGPERIYAHTTGPSDQLRAARARLQELRAARAQMSQPLSPLQNQLTADIEAKLRSGQLASKGFQAQSPADEILIPASQWRVLRFTSADRATGETLSYFGVQIGRPRNSPLRERER